MRYVDIVLVKYGQSAPVEIWLEPGICQGKNPRCDVYGGRRTAGAAPVLREAVEGGLVRCAVS